MLNRRGRYGLSERRPLTDLVNRLSRRKVICNAREHLHCVSWLEQRPSEVWEVADEDSRIKVSGEQMGAGIFEQGVLEAGEAYSLVDKA